MTDSGSVVQHRHASSQQREAQAIKSAAIVAGLQESAERGVALIGEIATSPICADAYSSSEIDVIAFLERLGRDDSQIDDKLDSLNVELVEFAFNNVDIGISPHAPYSVSDRLLDRLINWAVEKNIPLAMHLAESQSELELLETGTGPFTELLKKLNAWFPDSYTNGIRPQAYLDKLALAQNSLLIHGNYLSESELQFLADHRNRISVVFCPRTHSYFGHSPYPLARMLELGINVAVGTDSRASNPDLCLMSELQTISNAFPDVKPEEIVRMGTINGAQALGRSDAFGSLTPGKSACLCMVTCEPDLLNGDPYLAVLNGKPSFLR